MTTRQPQTQQLQALYFIAALLESAAAAYESSQRKSYKPCGPCVDVKYKPLQ